eukprot:m.199673 g.199673  ORF g.199673 m.199673 type:complete len:1952 (-) comp25923_c0_seq1:47-5902(-)
MLGLVLLWPGSSSSSSSSKPNSRRAHKKTSKKQSAASASSSDSVAPSSRSVPSLLSKSEAKRSRSYPTPSLAQRRSASLRKRAAEKDNLNSGSRKQRAVMSDSEKSEEKKDFLPSSEDEEEDSSPTQEEEPSSLHDLLMRLGGNMFSSYGDSSRYKNLLEGLSATGDDTTQMAALNEVTSMLLMGNEETLSGFRPAQFVPPLHELLNCEHNPQMALLACQALTNMIEAIPASGNTVAVCIPSLCAKLLLIEYIDLAEQSLTCLGKLSVNQGAKILQAGGLNAVLTFLDFFPMMIQRSALVTASNLCKHVSTSIFPMVQDSIPILSNLLDSKDQSMVESTCQCFAYIVHNLGAGNSEQLEQLTKHNLLPRLVQHISASPLAVNERVFSLIVKMLSTLCRGCPSLVEPLHRDQIGKTLRQILLSGQEQDDVVEEEIKSRETAPQRATAGTTYEFQPEQLFELVNFVCNLLPELPSSMFFVEFLNKTKGHKHIQYVVWEWQGDDSDSWQPYNKNDCMILEEAHQQGESSVTLTLFDRQYVVNLDDMMQLNRHTHRGRAVRRQEPVIPKETAPVSAADPRLELFTKHPALLESFCEPLLPVLFDIYLSTASPALREKLLEGVLKMLHFAAPRSLTELLRHLSISSYLTGMLGSADDKVVIGALQMAGTLMEKLPDIFHAYFRRKGVAHKIRELAGVSSLPAVEKSPAVARAKSRTKIPSPVAKTERKKSIKSKRAEAKEAKKDIASKEKPRFSRRSRKGKSGDDASDSSPASKSSTPSRSSISLSSSSSTLDPRAWVVQQATGLTREHFAHTEGDLLDPATDPHVAVDMLRKAIALTKAFEAQWIGDSSSSSTDPCPELPALRDLFSLLSNEEVSLSSFEAYHSGLIAALTKYLFAHKGAGPSPFFVDPTSTAQSRLDRIRTFCAVFFQDSDNNDGAATAPSTGGHATTVADTVTDLTARMEPIKPPKEIISDNFTHTDTGDFDIIPATPKTKPPSNVESETTIAMDVVENKSSVADTLNRWVDTLQGCLSMMEKFSVQDTTEADHRRIAHQLNAPIKLKLEREEDQRTLKDYPAQVVLIEPLASIQAIEEFLWPRVKRRKSGSSSSLGRSNSTSSHKTAESSKSTKAEEESSSKESETKTKTPARRSLRGKEKSAGQSESTSKSPKTARKGSIGKKTKRSSTKSTEKSKDTEKSKTKEKSKTTEKSKGTPKARSKASSSSTFSEMELEDKNEKKTDEDEEKKDHTSLDLDLDDEEEEEAEEEEEEDDDDDVDDDSQYRRRRGSSSSRRPDVYELRLPPAPEDQSSSDAADPDEPQLPSISGPLFITSRGARNKLTISLNGHALPSNITIYQAIKVFGGSTTPSPPFLSKSSYASYRIHAAMQSENIVTIKYRAYKPSDNNSMPSTSDDSLDPQSVKLIQDLAATADHPIETMMLLPSSAHLSTQDGVFPVLCLLRALNALNSHRHLLLSGPSAEVIVNPSHFVNNKLAAKILRQVSDLDTICQAAFPNWCLALMQACPFLVPFQKRQRYFFYTAFGSFRALQRYKVEHQGQEDDGQQQDKQNKLSRVKFRISRERIVESAYHILQTFATTKTILDIEYFNEIGTGLGPTYEFYSLVSRAFCERWLRLWRSSDDGESKHVFNANGLFPAPVASSKDCAVRLQLFGLLGRFLAKAVVDNRLVDMTFSPVFYRWLLGQEDQLGLSDLQYVDSWLYRTLKKLSAVVEQKQAVLTDTSLSAEEKSKTVAGLGIDGMPIADLSLYFTLQGYGDPELKEGGGEIPVTIDNVEEYIQLMTNFTLVDGVRRQMTAFRQGFESVFPLSSLQLFTPPEIEMILCGLRFHPWTVAELAEACVTDHGFSDDSKVVQWLYEVLSTYDRKQQRLFINFVTGTPNLPVGGLKGLSPPLKIVRKPSDSINDLPSVMTCQNYFKLPPYASKEILAKKLEQAVIEGQGSFHLS